MYDAVIDLKKTTKPIIKKNKEPFILFVGRIEDAKGVTELINVFINLIKLDAIDDKINLKLAGTYKSDFYSFLNEKILLNNVQNRIEFLGFRADRYQLMSNAIATIVPSYNEGFGFITAEAMFNGCLVIGRNTAGTKEQFDKGFQLKHNEIGIRYNTSDELFSELERTCNNQLKNIYKMLQDAQDTVCELYTTEVQTNKILKIYETVVK